MGDEVLAAIGPSITSCLREADFAGRFGGEEFLILLPDTDGVNAKNVAEKIRRAIAGLSVPGVDRSITASLGVAELVEQNGTSAGLLRGADRAQYAAKAAGRNRVVVATTPAQDVAIPLQAAHGAEPGADSL
jgi:diguanylate cyclase (GGDEF)-like protein